MDILKDFREKHNLKQQELGEYLGVTGNTVARWERGEMKTPEKMLELALFALDLKINQSENRKKIEAMKKEINETLEQTLQIVSKWN